MNCFTLTILMIMSICALCFTKSQYRQLPEWVDYHLAVGVDHFYICQDVTSNIEMRLVERLLGQYIKDNVVTLYDARELFPNTLDKNYGARQKPFYNLILNQLKLLKDLNPYEWVTCLDTDDFIVPQRHGTIPRFLEQFDSNEICGILLNGMLFGCGNSNDIPIYTPDSIIATCQCVLQNERAIKSISSVKQATYLHCHDMLGDKPAVNAEGKSSNFVNVVPSYGIAFYAHYVQPSLESLNAKWQNANYPYQGEEDSQRSRRDIAINRFTNNEWINYPKKDKFDTKIISSIVLDLYNLRKAGLLPLEPELALVVELSDVTIEQPTEQSVEELVEQPVEQPEIVDVPQDIPQPEPELSESEPEQEEPTDET